MFSYKLNAVFLLKNVKKCNNSGKALPKKRKNKGRARSSAIIL